MGKIHKSKLFKTVYSVLMKMRVLDIIKVIGGKNRRKHRSGGKEQEETSVRRRR